MKIRYLTRLLTVAALITCTFPGSARAQGGAVEETVMQFISELARRQGFTYLASPGNDAAKPGSVYWVGQPWECPSKIRAATELGQPVSVNKLADMSENVVKAASAAKVGDFTAIRIDRFLGAGAKAAIMARSGKAEAEVSASLKALSQSNAQVHFASLENGSFPLRQAAKQFLKENSIVSPSDLATDAKGLLVPYAQLIFQKFEFDIKAVKGAEAGFAAEFLDLFKAKLDAKTVMVDEASFKYPTNAVVAFKYDTLLFQCQ